MLYEFMKNAPSLPSAYAGLEILPNSVTLASRLEEIERELAGMTIRHDAIDVKAVCWDGQVPYIGL